MYNYVTIYSYNILVTTAFQAIFGYNHNLSYFFYWTGATQKI